jgi:hypothetical protein
MAAGVCLAAGWSDLASAATCEDCDGDGFTAGEGDCDDNEELESPGIPKETCGDRLDNDCNGFYDDGCDLSVRQGTIQGGGGCTGNNQGPSSTGGTTAALFLLPWLGARARRRGDR